MYIYIYMPAFLDEESCNDSALFSFVVHAKLPVSNHGFPCDPHPYYHCSGFPLTNVIFGEKLPTIIKSDSRGS